MQTSFEIRDRVAWIGVDDGKVNAMTERLLVEIGARLDEAAQGADVCVLTGRPGIFSAGFHLPTLMQGEAAARSLVEAGVQLILKMLRYPRPIIVGCTGHAYPMGAFLLLCADYKVGVAGNFQIGLNEVAIGITVPDFALTLATHRLTAPGLARVGTGELADPNQAEKFGYLDRVCELNDFESQLQAGVERLCAIDLGAFAATKEKRHRDLIAEIESGLVLP